jgi:hypothetical protein
MVGVGECALVCGRYNPAVLVRESCMRIISLMALLTILVVHGGCRSAYYAAWEKLGWEKRHLLSDRVAEARDAQAAAAESFQTTLERFQELTGFEGGDLEAMYRRLSSQYNSAESRANAVTGRINAVDQVAKDMFAEWQQELRQYQDARLRAQSERQLNETRDRYGDLLQAMRRAESRMEPVLGRFRDQVLFLKHNLNARAIASLQGTTQEIELDVQQLIKEMESAIAEANAFIGTLQ